MSLARRRNAPRFARRASDVGVPLHYLADEAIHARAASLRRARARRRPNRPPRTGRSRPCHERIPRLTPDEPPRDLAAAGAPKRARQGLRAGLSGARRAAKAPARARA